MSVCIIAEAGVNHNGDVNIAKELCYKAKEAGADVIKFQTWITEKIITKSVKQAEYQERNNANKISQYDMLKTLELRQEDFVNIKRYCDEIGILFASTADEEDSLDFLIELGMPFIKIGSGEIGNIPYLRKIGEKKQPIILSTGMSNLGEVELSINALREGGSDKITLLHCTTSYPCKYNDVNLKAMDTLKNSFQLPVGYSDHTLGSEIAIAAVARGASVIEKHFTLDRDMIGPDHIASMEPEDFKFMVQCIRNVEFAMGDGLKSPTSDERIISEVVMKKIVAKRFIPVGKIIDSNDICVKRSEDGMPASLWDYIVGVRANRDYNIDEGISLYG